MREVMVFKDVSKPDNGTFQIPVSDGKLVTKCYTAREDYYGWCATCNLNSTKESDPNFCNFDGDDGGRSKKVGAGFEPLTSSCVDLNNG